METSGRLSSSWGWLWFQRSPSQEDENSEEAPESVSEKTSHQPSVQHVLWNRYPERIDPICENSHKFLTRAFSFLFVERTTDLDDLIVDYRATSILDAFHSNTTCTCPFCSFDLENHIKGREDGFLPIKVRPHSLEYFHGSLRYPCGFWLGLEGIFGDKSKDHISVGIKIDVSAEGESDFTKSLGIQVDQRLDADGKFVLIKDWIFKGPADCFSADSTFMPTRLLHLAKDGRVKLVNTTERPFSKFRYVALSHRWGSSQHLTSTQESVPRLCSGVNIQELPMTFRDAFEVVSRLGISYLWIDALCILQDDEEDWERESKMMGDVYGHARFTIAAHCANDDSEGFLAKSMSKRPAVEFMPDPDTTLKIYHAPTSRDVGGSQLCKRGWVLQERLLSPRTIHFTEGQIYFESIEGLFSESTVGGGTSMVSTPFGWPSNLPSLRAYFKTGCNNDRDLHSDDTLEQPVVATPPEWLNLIETYSCCNLTKPEDKLMAISGMAQKIYHHTNVPYCAGIWGDRIYEGLLWISGDTNEKSDTNRAPSWSWASKNGAIYFPKVNDRLFWRPLCYVIRATTESAESGNGWLNGPGSLQLNMTIIPFPMAYITPSKVIPDNIFYILDVLYCCSHVAKHLHQLEDRTDEYWSGLIIFDEQSSNTCQQIKIPGFFFGAVACQLEYGSRESRMIHGLFLARTGNEQNEYRRVGFGMLSSEHLQDMDRPLHNSTTKTISIV